MLTAKANRKRAQRQENQLAHATGSKTQRGSGCLPWAKGDVRKKGVFRAECKFTKKRSFSIKRQVLDKIRGECSYGEIPVLDITFIDAHGRTEDRWVCAPYETWVAYQKEQDAANVAFDDSRPAQPSIGPSAELHEHSLRPQRPVRKLRQG